MFVQTDNNFYDFMVRLKKYADEEKASKIIDTSYFIDFLIDQPDNLIFNYVAYHSKPQDYKEAKRILHGGGFINRDTRHEETIYISTSSEIETQLKDENTFIIDQTMYSIFDPSCILAMVEDELHSNKPYKLHHFVLALIRKMPRSLKLYLEFCKIGIADFQSFYDPKSFSIKNILPGELAGYLNDNTVNFIKGQNCKTLGREKEVKTLWNILLKKTKSNAILVGPPGVGKTAIIDTLTYQIVNETCPKDFLGFKILSLDVTSLVAGTTYRGDAESKFVELIDFLERTPNIILFIDEIHLIMGAGTSVNNHLDLANALKPLLARDNARVIGATTDYEYQKYFSQDPATRRRFERVEVREPKTKDVYKMIKNKLIELEAFHKVKISKEMVDYVALNASCFNYESKNPDKTIDLIDRSMVSAKLANHDYVTQEDVLENFQNNFSNFKELDSTIKKVLAYHEIGHFIVWRELDNGLYNELLAITIIPSSSFYGLNVMEENPIIYQDLNYFQVELATILAGRISEDLIATSKSVGSAQDIALAKKIATAVVNEYHMTNDKLSIVSNEIADIDNLLEKSQARAKSIIDNNIDLLKTLVDAILVEGILSKTQLDKLCEKCEKRKK